MGSVLFKVQYDEVRMDGRTAASIYVCAEASEGRSKVLRADIIFDYRSFKAGTI